MKRLRTWLAGRLRDAAVIELRGQLEAERRAHEVTRHEKRCIESENRLLATIHETDVARRSAERAIQLRREVEAESATDELRDRE